MKILSIKKSYKLDKNIESIKGYLESFYNNNKRTELSITESNFSIIIVSPWVVVDWIIINMKKMFILSTIMIEGFINEEERTLNIISNVLGKVFPLLFFLIFALVIYLLNDGYSLMKGFLYFFIFGFIAIAIVTLIKLFRIKKEMNKLIIFLKNNNIIME